ncbi:MAG: response regulator transcription factor [Flavobacteriaceae bacterium]|nr:response regulator transcription factor [Flavobacteriaceae bacterium]
MTNLTAILIDDIPVALEMLTNDLIHKHPEIAIIGTAKSVVEGAKLLQKQKPDILFLDIMLGDGTGFDLLEIVPNLTAKIIFVTASDEFALRAFKFAAIDYILKPYSDKELANAIEKVKENMQPDKEQLHILKKAVSTPGKYPTKISLHTFDKITVVSLSDVIRCESDNNYTTFFFEDGQKILVSKTLKYYADLLNEQQFLRVHRSHLVNMKYIASYIKTDGGYLMLKNKKSIPVSVRKRSEVIEALDNIL